jgi:hypothetical protein
MAHFYVSATVHSVGGFMTSAGGLISPKGPDARNQPAPASAWGSR